MYFFSIQGACAKGRIVVLTSHKCERVLLSCNIMVNLSDYFEAAFTALVSFKTIHVIHTTEVKAM